MRPVQPYSDSSSPDKKGLTHTVRTVKANVEDEEFNLPDRLKASGIARLLHLPPDDRSGDSDSFSEQNRDIRDCRNPDLTDDS